MDKVGPSKGSAAVAPGCTMAALTMSAPAMQGTSGGCISRGSVLCMNGDSASTRHYLVCGIQKDQLHREGNPLDGCLLHCQRLAPELRLPYKDEVLTFALHGEPSVLVETLVELQSRPHALFMAGDNKFRVLPADEQPHLDIPCTHFAKEWACGRADVLPSGAQLFYTVHPTCDQLSLPELASCASCSCGCLNPWSAHEHGPTELAQDSASCRYRGEAYRRGDLAWVVPPVDAEVDAELHLVGSCSGRRRPAMKPQRTPAASKQNPAALRCRTWLPVLCRATSWASAAWRWTTLKHRS